MVEFTKILVCRYNKYWKDRETEHIQTGKNCGVIVELLFIILEYEWLLWCCNCAANSTNMTAVLKNTSLGRMNQVHSCVGLWSINIKHTKYDVTK